MAQEMISCPLCSAPSFSSTNSLCFTLVNITSKRLRCTLCEEELNGLDKFTLHLLSHLIQNSDFKRCLINDGFSTKASACFGTNSVANLEPLNLVKSSTTSQHVLHTIARKALNSDHFSPVFEEKDIGKFSNERPSLKIDNEVMIFFNPNEEVDENNKESSEFMEGSRISSGMKAPQSPLHTGQYLETLHPLCPEDKRSIVGFNSKNANGLPPEMQANLYPTSDRFSNNPDTRTSLSPTEPLVDIISVNKQDNVKKRPLDTSETIKCNVNKSEIVGSTDKPFTKSSFLSPKGERILGFRCDICSLVFPDEHIMLMHRQLIHIEISGDPLKTNRFKCHLCSKSFVMRGSLMVHMRVAHFGGAGKKICNS